MVFTRCNQINVIFNFRKLLMFRRRHQWPLEVEHLCLFARTGHERQQCSLKSAQKCMQLLDSFEKKQNVSFFQVSYYITIYNFPMRVKEYLASSLGICRCTFFLYFPHTYTEHQMWVNATEIINFLMIARNVNENSRINF